MRRSHAAAAALLVATASSTNYFPLANVYLYRHDNRQWVRSSPLLAAR